MSQVSWPGVLSPESGVRSPRPVPGLVSNIVQACNALHSSLTLLQRAVGRGTAHTQVSNIKGGPTARIRPGSWAEPPLRTPWPPPAPQDPENVCRVCTLARAVYGDKPNSLVNGRADVYVVPRIPLQTET